MDIMFISKLLNVHLLPDRLCEGRCSRTSLAVPWTSPVKLIVIILLSSMITPTVPFVHVFREFVMCRYITGVAEYQVKILFL